MMAMSLVMSLFNRSNPERKTGRHLYTAQPFSQFGKQAKAGWESSEKLAKKIAPTANGRR
jgi:hypothetical protein